MSGWLLDTNVLSKLRTPRPCRRVADFVGAQPLDYEPVHEAGRIPAQENFAQECSREIAEILKHFKVFLGHCRGK